MFDPVTRTTGNKFYNIFAEILSRKFRAKNSLSQFMTHYLHPFMEKSAVLLKTCLSPVDYPVVSRIAAIRLMQNVQTFLACAFLNSQMYNVED